MGGEIAATREAITEALTDVGTVLDITHQLTPLHEAALDASINTYASLEAAASGLSRFLEKSSLAKAALGAEEIDSVESRLEIAHTNRESAVEAGKEAAFELGLALTGYTTIISRTKEMQAYFDGESGARELLKKAAKTASAALAGDLSQQNRRFTGELISNVSHVTFISSQFRAGRDAATFGEKSLSGITDRVREAVMILMNSEDMSAQQLETVLESVQGQAIRKDAKEVAQLIRDTSEIKNNYALYIPRQQHELQKYMQTAIELGTQIQAQL